MAYGGSVSAFDIDNDPLTYSLLTEPSHGMVAITDSSAGTFTYSPTVNYNGSDSFTFTSSDGTLLDTAKVSLTINSVNDSPLAFEEIFYDVELMGCIIDASEEFFQFHCLECDFEWN